MDIESNAFQHGIGAESELKASMKLPILNKTNYLHWKFRMEYAFGKKKLWGIVTGDIPQPTEEDERKAWEGLDYDARQLIVMTVGHDQDGYIFRAKSAKQMWDNLQEAYQEKSSANSIQLKSVFYKLKKKKEHNMTEHINYMWELMENLKALGVDLPEEDTVMVLLDSVPPEYTMITTALKVHDGITFERCAGRLKQAEREMKNSSRLEVKVEERESALVANPRYQQKRAQGKLYEKRDIRRCYHCGKPGHISTECRSNPAANSKCNNCQR